MAGQKKAPMALRQSRREILRHQLYILTRSLSQYAQNVTASSPSGNVSATQRSTSQGIPS